MPDVLETVDLDGVEILAADVPIHGVGSPPEGDIYSREDVAGFADRASALKGELWTPAKLDGPPNKPEHGLHPAVGWLDNIRPSDDGAKLLTDIKKVPKKFADIIEAGGYRTRSIEIGNVVSQKQTNDDGTPKVFENVIKGLAWLGGKIPAVRTLDDVVALYEGAEMTAPEDGDRVLLIPNERAFATGDVIWDPEGGYQDLLSDVQEAINPGPGQTRYWVSDISIDRTRAIVQDYDGGQAWIVPVSIDGGGNVTVGPSSDWTEAEQAWVAAAKEYAAKTSKPASDSRSIMPDAPKFTDEHRRKFAEAAGLEQANVTDEMLAKAGVAGETSEPDPEDPPNPEGDEKTRALEERLTKNEERVADAEKRAFEAGRDAIIVTALQDGRLEPGERETWEKLYEADPASAVAAIAKLPKNDELAREYGSSEEGAPPSDDAEFVKLFEADLAQRIGVPVEGLI